mmetsp:Transcript_6539/g.13349  ORF Transcript_6539/g.13349 Transcript_6539/m.13349 type:complete len:233 (-) Transcript_6539:603-1301(-)
MRISRASHVHLTRISRIPRTSRVHPTYIPRTSPAYIPYEIEIRPPPPSRQHRRKRLLPTSTPRGTRILGRRPTRQPRVDGPPVMLHHDTASGDATGASGTAGGSSAAKDREQPTRVSGIYGLVLGLFLRVFFDRTDVRQWRVLVSLDVRVRLLPERREALLAISLHERLVVGTYKVLEKLSQLMRAHLLRPHQKIKDVDIGFCDGILSLLGQRNAEVELAQCHEARHLIANS